MQFLTDLRADMRISTDVFVNQILSDKEHLFGRASNISRHGMCVFSLPRDMEVSRFLWVCFWLPNSEELLRALCEVVHVHEVGDVVRTGVKFKYVSPRHRTILNGYLADHSNSVVC